MAHDFRDFHFGPFFAHFKIFGFCPSIFSPQPFLVIISITYFHILIADLDTNEGLLLLAIPRKNDGNRTRKGWS